MSKYCSIFRFGFLSILDVLCYPWKGPAGMHYPSLNKPPWAVSDWEKHLASLVSWSEFYLFWRLGWLTAWTAVSSLLLWMVQQHWKAACAWILLSVLAHQPLWCCGLWIGLCGSVFFSPFQSRLLLTDDWQAKITKNNKRPGGLGPAVLALPLSVMLGPWPSSSWFSLGKPGALSWEGYI